MSSEVRLHHCREDRAIERDVRAELETDQDIADQCLIDVSVNDGVVHLSGFAGASHRSARSSVPWLASWG